MKNKVKILSVVLFLASVILFTCSWSAFREEDGQGHANIVAYSTPLDPNDTGAIFSRRFTSKNGTSYNSSPIITNDRIYIVNEAVLYELGMDGEILHELTLSGKMNSTCRMTAAEDFLYIPLSSGRIECIKLPDMTSVWRSEEFGGQSLASLYYHNGHLYTGTTVMENAENTSGLFYCLDASDGKTIWTYKDETPCGYYWSGAISYGNALFFAGDNGTLVSHSLLTDEVYDKYPLSSSAKIRTDITYDKDSDCLYTAANDGTLYKIQASRSGKITEVSQAKILPDASFINCTSTPTIYKNRIYLGCMADTEGYLCVLDAGDLSLLYKISLGRYKEVKSSPLLSTAYEENAILLYFTCNAPPGGIYMLTERAQAAEGEATVLFTPENSQYCLSSIAAGEDGRLYYSNDSGTFFAVGKGGRSTASASSSSPLPEISSSTAPPLPTPSPAPLETGKAKKTLSVPKKKKTKVTVKTPRKFTAKRKKDIWRLCWKTPSKKYQTLLYIRTGGEKWKSQNLKRKTACRLPIRAGKKKIRVRLRCRVKKNGKWLYSKYTKTLTL